MVRRYVVIVLVVGLRGARRLQRTCGPKLRVVVRAVVKIAGGEGEHAELLALHVLVAAATGAGLTLAAAFTAGPPAELLKIVRLVAIGAVAVSAAVVLVRRTSGSARRTPVRPLIRATARRLDSGEAPPAAARALQLVCDPPLLWAGPNAIRPALCYAARNVLSHVAKHPLTHLSPAIVPALELLDGYHGTVDSARFVRQFALTAVEVSREPSLLALS